MKKIAYLISRFPAVSHTFIQREIGALRKQGLEIALFSINRPDIDPAKLTENDKALMDETFYVKEASLSTLLKGIVSAFTQSPSRFIKTFFKALGMGFYSLFYFLEAAVIGSELNEKKIDHLHVHFANPAATVALLIHSLFGKTYSITVHGPEEFYDVTPNHLAEKFANAKFLICISYYAQSQVMRVIPPDSWNKLHINRMGIDPKLYAPTSKSDLPFIIVSVGRLSVSKGQPILCQAVQELQKEGFPIQLNLIGEGPERKILESYATPSIHLLGALNPDEVRDVLQKSSLFILSSFAEGVPVSLMEAMATEIPCIAPGINGIPELIIHETSGLLVYPSDIEGLKAAILRLYRSPAEREKLGKGGRQHVLEHYDLETNTQQLVGLIHSEIIK